MKFGTKVIHAGQKPDPSTGAIMTPIFQTSTYAQEAPGVHKGYEYARTQNPTRDALQANLAALENGEFAYCFASGLAATDTLVKLFSPADEIICTNDLYGGTFRLFSKVFEKYGLVFHFVDMTDIAVLDDLLGPKTKLIWLETPTNPMIKILDIRAICDRAAQFDTMVCVDNTFASPFLQNPLDLGADIVMHSVTKYIAGHSDVIMGALIVNDEKLGDQLAFLQNSCGAVPGPQDCFLVLRGIKTLHVRMERHCTNGEAIAHFLNAHPKVKGVNWPGFKDHPGHAIARDQMKGFGGMLSFFLTNDTQEAAFDFMKQVKYFTLAESLGGVESLCGHPASMTHASIPLEERLKVGLTDSLIRLSVGIEDVDDLVSDLEQALAVT